MRTNATAAQRRSPHPGLLRAPGLLRVVQMPSMLLLLLAAALMVHTAAADPSIGEVIGQIRERAAATTEDGGTTTPAPPNKTRNERILEQWSKFELNLQDLVDSVIRKVLPTVIRRSSELEVSPDCRDALLKVVFGIRQLKRWAFQWMVGYVPAACLLFRIEEPPSPCGLDCRIDAAMVEAEATRSMELTAERVAACRSLPDLYCFVQFIGPYRCPVQSVQRSGSLSAAGHETESRPLSQRVLYRPSAAAAFVVHGETASSGLPIRHTSEATRL
ncbi:hypothetical protein HPB50_023296 [Hyalomma asiaticum]|uniref:Uncharacterized protein n=1 Tax=Hyalomma asiaticum TaxID=266040 RepID=A0ACB7TQ45_HYAAI|nr:hypothetical protein HPB50_023296 [Hyalomma asiaticum]